MVSLGEIDKVQLIGLALVTIFAPSYLEIWFIRILLLTTLSLHYLKPLKQKYGLKLDNMINTVL